MYAATGDPRFKERADYMVEQLKEVQDKQGDGYIGALMGDERVNGTNQLVDGKILFQQLAAGENPVRRVRPKRHVVAVVCRAQDFCRPARRLSLHGNRTALEVEIKFAGWAGGIVTNLNEAQDQRMLNTEFGGMNEVLADLYADTGDKQWLALSGKFEHTPSLSPWRSTRTSSAASMRTRKCRKSSVIEALHLHRQRNRRLGGKLFLGPGRVPSHLCHRRGGPRRILRPA